MSLAAWYHHKADQCAQMAEGAIEPGVRIRYLEDQTLWLELEVIELAEESRLGAPVH